MNIKRSSKMCATWLSFSIHMHKMDPRGSTHNIFGDQFYNTFSNMFYARKLKLQTEFKRNCELCSNLVRAHKSIIHNFKWVRSSSGKIMRSYVFKHENGEIHGIWAFWDFLNKSGRQLYGSWVSRDPTASCFCNVIKKHANNLNQTVTL